MLLVGISSSGMFSPREWMAPITARPPPAIIVYPPTRTMLRELEYEQPFASIARIRIEQTRRLTAPTISRIGQPT